METWRPLNEEGLYLVSSMGRIWLRSHPTADGRTMRARLVKCTTSKRDGYVRFNFRYNGAKCCKTLHRAVAEAFVPNPENKPEINHINGIKTDNRAENLEWCTASENQKHSLAHGLRTLNCPATSKKVAAYTLDGELIATYPSAAEASRATGESIHRIYHQCEGKCQKPANGYYWRHAKP